MNTFHKRVYPTVLLIFAIMFVHLSLYSQSIDQQIDSLLSEKFSAGSTGAVCLVAKNGEQIFKKAYGFSNLELESPMATDNVFEIGSITKQFTAIAILLLEERGKLATDDLVSGYVSDYPNGDQISIHHLLTHTSGIKDFSRVKGLNEIATRELAASEMVDFFKNEAVNFAPGEQYEYCNAGYILLGHIIEIVSEQSYGQFIEENIFQPLQMTNSYYCNHRRLIPNRASGYNKKGEQFYNNRYISYSIPFASGSLMSTVDDLFKWQEAIKNNTIISEASTKKAFTNHQLNNGEHINYGYGWHVKSRDGRKVYEHGGSIFGFKSMGVYIPEEDIYVISLTNCGCNSPTEITREISSIVATNMR